MMRLLTWAGIGVLTLTLGISAAGAQDEPKRPEESKPEQNEARPQQTPADQDKQEMKKEQNQAPKENKQTKEEKQQQKDDARGAKDNGKDQMNQNDMNRGEMNHAQANQGQMNHAQGANGKSGRIPDRDFKAHFGRQHTVVINQPVVVEGQPRFQYGGYWFVISDPWPGDWAYSDQCYIDYVDGEYFLFDLLHPGVRIALFVVVG